MSRVGTDRFIIILGNLRLSRREIWSIVQCTASKSSGLSMNLSVLPAACRQKNQRRSLPTGRRQHLGGGGSIDRSQFEKIFHEREHGAVKRLYLRVRRVDDVV